MRVSESMRLTAISGDSPGLLCVSPGPIVDLVVAQLDALLEQRVDFTDPVLEEEPSGVGLRREAGGHGLVPECRIEVELG